MATTAASHVAPAPPGGALQPARADRSPKWSSEAGLHFREARWRGDGVHTEVVTVAAGAVPPLPPADVQRRPGQQHSLHGVSLEASGPPVGLPPVAERTMRPSMLAYLQSGKRPPGLPGEQAPHSARVRPAHNPYVQTWRQFGPPDGIWTLDRCGQAVLASSKGSLSARSTQHKPGDIVLPSLSRQQLQASAALRHACETAVSTAASAAVEQMTSHAAAAAAEADAMKHTESWKHRKPSAFGNQSSDGGAVGLTAKASFDKRHGANVVQRKSTLSSHRQSSVGPRRSIIVLPHSEELAFGSEGLTESSESDLDIEGILKPLEEEPEIVEDDSFVGADGHQKHEEKALPRFNWGGSVAKTKAKIELGLEPDSPRLKVKKKQTPRQVRAPVASDGSRQSPKMRQVTSAASTPAAAYSVVSRLSVSTQHTSCSDRPGSGSTATGTTAGAVPVRRRKTRRCTLVNIVQQREARDAEDKAHAEAKAKAADKEIRAQMRKLKEQLFASVHTAFDEEVWAQCGIGVDRPRPASNPFKDLRTPVPASGLPADSEAACSRSVSKVSHAPGT
eukprot:TRINITY_DN34591_c0_g1_i2.p1 TRINITY_DN34591_c0_g1~~TRINITY_DN34591_c0_g1_i2.p1  ORF type:complete len:562 (+),score=120.14 TRINITY_DN34591_c0_g1_i2:132-1817(+)